MDHEQRMELMRRVMDPAVRFSVPILGVSVSGWWIQIARRLIWVTSETEDDGRLLELLLDNTMTGGEDAPLAAVEPIMIAAPMTRQPADWAFTARVWNEGVLRPIDRPWSKIAKAIHGHGIPTITLDPISTPYEIACQVVLKGYWHGYIGSDEPALANAVVMAYPRQVERIHRGVSGLEGLPRAELIALAQAPAADNARKDAEMVRLTAQVDLLTEQVAVLQRRETELETENADLRERVARPERLISQSSGNSGCRRRPTISSDEGAACKNHDCESPAGHRVGVCARSFGWR